MPPKPSNLLYNAIQNVIYKRAGSIFVVCQTDATGTQFFTLSLISFGQYTLQNPGFTTCGFLLIYEDHLYMIGIYRDSSTQLRYKSFVLR